MIPKNLNQVTLVRIENNVTGRMGLSWTAHSLKHYGVEEILDKHFQDKHQSPRAIASSRKITEGALTLIAGGEKFEDMEVLRADKGLCASLGRKKLISPDTLRELLRRKTSGGSLRKSNEELMIRVMKESAEMSFTYDNDATYFDSEKKSAEYSYQKRRQFSGLLGFIAELGICVTADFRRGNVSPREGIYNQLRKAIKMAQKAGKRIGMVRMDSAGHQDKIFALCRKAGINYYISLVKNDEVMESILNLEASEWNKMPTDENAVEDREWAETVYAPNRGEAMRMLVLRWPNPNPELFDSHPYCYHAIGTNHNEIGPMAWLELHNGRMNSENYNKEIKSGLGGDYAPSHEFDMNRNYFLLNMFTYNLVQIMKLFYLGANARKWTPKTLRYWFIEVCGKLVKSGRRYICQIINACDETYAMFENCLSRLVVTT